MRTHQFFPCDLERTSSARAFRRTGLAVCALWMIVATASGLVNAAETVIENDYLRLEITHDSAKSYISKLYDISADRDYINSNVYPENMWRVDLVDEQGGAYELKTHLGQYSDQLVMLDDRQILTMAWKGLTVSNATDTWTDAVDISVVAALMNDSSRCDWYICVHIKKASLGVHSVRFLNLSNLGRIGGGSQNDRLLVPQGTGRLIVNPVRNLSGSTTLAYPSSNCSMQCMAYFDPASGLYMAMLDNGFHQKNLRYWEKGDNNDAIGIFYELFPDVVNVPGADFSPTYPLRMEFFSGGSFMQAARFYRDWALQQPWANKGRLADRTDLGGVRDVDLLILAPSMVSDSPEKNINPFEEYLETIEQLQEWDLGFDLDEVDNWFSAFLQGLPAGTETILFDTKWTLDGFDVGYPRFEARKNFQAFNDWLSGHGVKTMPYVNIRRVVAVSGFDWWSDHQFDIEPECVLKDDGTWFTSSMRNVQTRIVWPGHQFWQSYWRNKADKLSGDYDASGMYLDELSAMASMPNYVTESTQGLRTGPSGRHWVLGTRALAKEIKQAGALNEPDFFISGEQASETYLDVVDASLLYGQSQYFDDIPLFQAVYHDYAVCFGRTFGKWSDDYRKQFYPEDHRDGDTNLDEFYIRFGKAFVTGEAIGTIRSDLQDYSQEAYNHIIELINFRRTFADYLKHGVMLDYVEGGFTGAESITFDACIWTNDYRTDLTFPGVVYSVWGSPTDKSVAIVVANLSDQSRSSEFVVDINEWLNDPAAMWTKTIRDSLGQTVSGPESISAQNPIVLQQALSARQIRVIVFTPQE